MPDKYNDAAVQNEAPPQQETGYTDTRQPTTFADKTRGEHWHATDNTATSKKKGRR